MPSPPAPSPPVSREREIFLAALDRATPEDRRAFLDSACAADPSLRRAVEGLLAEVRDDDFLDRPPWSVPTLAGAETTPSPIAFAHVERPGDRIGRYKLLEVIGEGGGGTVFMAEQEEPIRRRVALKVIKPGMDTRSVVARFESERQALALMDHPNIARVLDGGATTHGRPYFVMELVRGVRITQYCDEHRLGTPERLELFVQVCQAIQHAHHKGIIHRDIKPSNILVTLHDGVPVPKVIDFGIAKAIDQRLTDKTVFTEFRAFIGTPAYMSPEQAEMSGLDIDTRSDVYSLGVLLYELLTGRPPFDGQALIDAGLDALRRTLRETEPAAPSTRLRSLGPAERTTTASRHRSEPAKLVRLLRGDLDWIVLKALEKDRNRRYETAHDLAADVRRFLRDEAILARPPGAFYRLGKLARRHRLAFAVTGAFATALVLGLAVATVQYLEKSEAYQRARHAELEQRLLAHQARRSAVNEAELRSRAEAQEARARRTAYAADMNLARHALAMNNLGRARGLLERHRPTPGAPDLRGWEWRYLWQQCRSDALFTLCERSNEVEKVVVSADGNHVALGETSGRVSIWDLRVRAESAHFETNPGRNLPLAFGRRSPLLAFGETDGPGPIGRRSRLRLWDLAERRFRPEIPLAGPCRGLAFSSDDATLLVLDASGQVTQWDPWHGERLSVLALPPLGPLGPLAAISADLKRAAVAVERGRVRLYDLADGDELWTADAADEDLKALAFSPDGSLLATGAGFVESAVRLLEVATGRELARLEGHRTWVSSLVFWPDGKTLASASGDQTIRLWDLADLVRHPAPSESRTEDRSQPRTTGPNRGTVRERTTLRGHRLEVWSVALLPDRSTLVSSSKDGEVCVWDTTNLPRDRSPLTLPEPVRSWTFAPDGKSILAGDDRGRVVRWQGPDFQNPRFELTLGSPAMVTHFSADTRYAIVHDGPRFRVWDLARGRPAQDWSNPVAGLVPLGFVGTPPRLATLRWRTTQVQEWDLETGRTVATRDLGESSAPWFGPVPSPDGRWWWVPQGTGATLVPRDDQPGRSPVPLEGASFPIVAFSPDSSRLAGVGRSGTGALWDTATGRRIGEFDGFLQGLHSAAFSPDGRRLAIGSNGREAVKVWSVEQPQELLTLEGEGSWFGQAAFSPDGTTIAASNARGILHLWRAPSPETTDPTSNPHDPHR